MSKPSPYPKDFLWGASTSSYQVEGGNDNQWSVWENQNADRLAAEAEKTFGQLGADWQRFKIQASDPANYVSGIGVDHFNQYEEDFNILKSLNMNSFRFGIEWSRVQPREGEWDEAAIAHYHTYIAALKARGITPMLTLWHWTMPTWFTDKGGFEKKANLQHWQAYVARMAAEFGSEVRYWLTLNEPNVYALIGYGIGMWPPQKKAFGCLGVYRNLVAAHQQAYAILKQANPDLQISIAMNLNDAQPTAPANPFNRLAVRFRMYAWNWWYLKKVHDQLDFIGVNFYNTDYVNWFFKMKKPTKPLNDLGWYMEPGGLGTVLIKTWQRYKLPLIITENGLADADDSQRQWWIEHSLIAVQRAMGQGADVRGYMHWSLLDNFEWSYGWWPEFGLVHVNRKTMKRTVRPSARWFAQYIQRLYLDQQG